MLERSLLTVAQADRYQVSYCETRLFTVRSPSMSISWFVICEKHRELLHTGRDKPGKPPSVVASLRRELERETGRSPEQRSADERLLAVLDAFLRRHQGCGLEIIADWSPGFEEFYQQVHSSPHLWTRFDVIDEDGPYNRALGGGKTPPWPSSWPPLVEYRRSGYYFARTASYHRAQLKVVQGDLRDERTPAWARPEFEKKMEIEENELRKWDQAAEMYKARPWDEDGFLDLLDLLRKLPLRPPDS